ncbi:hypothetical protein RYA95_23900 [Pseudomonas syringae pv. actinidiae]|uniref:hypothetical protein n=1 Tax=Pseudomonas TaxID=286 RepID=UPI00046641B4|nr:MULTISPECIES: hypothetical protein [Pseudomonas]AYL81087.1 hypothetical protein CN228_15025 [Pseudomonas syringae pv. actinidiae str. Shaanxi_M228]MBL3607145.1 hypothetical protein [Pseudomonas syringae pv. actinidiae]MDU8616096.1 hypothetical protein [Pseudomonas syringae pv. actinidiae]OSN79071.1 Formate hydrogenlyase transcriptional activator [Pseudomonas syringae pv. actinidiae]OSR65070.1 Formate hydrogenlyase transcriptional activator [Pseudomonas syringae pv. actinidiae]
MLLLAATYATFQNIIERALVTSNGPDLNLDLTDESKLPAQSTQLPSASNAILTDAQIRELERSNVQSALKATAGKLFVKGGAAELLGLKSTTLASRLKRLDVKLDE